MALLPHPNQSYRWLFAELTVVVIGILIAFQVEEWRTNSSERAEEVVSLTGLHNDLTADYARLDVILASQTTTLGALNSLAAYILSSDPRSSEKLASMFQAASRISTYIPRAPTYIGLRSTGRLRIIESEDLRAFIYDYFESRQPFMDSFQEGNTEAWSQFHFSALQDMYVATDAHSGQNTMVFETGETTGRVAIVLPLEEIPRNPEFMGYLGRYSARLQNSLGQIARMQAENIELQEQIDNYVDRRR